MKGSFNEKHAGKQKLWMSYFLLGAGAFVSLFSSYKTGTSEKVLFENCSHLFGGGGWDEGDMEAANVTVHIQGKVN